MEQNGATAALTTLRERGGCARHAFTEPEETPGPETPAGLSPCLGATWGPSGMAPRPDRP
eukprot:4230978-Pyramimonas_sp.AAC.1